MGKRGEIMRLHGSAGIGVVPTPTNSLQAKPVTCGTHLKNVVHLWYKHKNQLKGVNKWKMMLSE